MALKEIIVIRHAQSLEDVDPTIHNLIPDDQIGLTDLGKRQVKVIAPSVRHIVGQSNLLVCLSPSKRAVETYEFLFNNIDKKSVQIIIEERIRNLNWGNITLENRDQIESERYAAGVLYYKFPEGDDSILYVQRIKEAMLELTQDSQKSDFPEYLLIIAHGFALRVIVKVLTDMSDKDFKWLSNPPNCFVAQISCVNGKFICNTELPLYRHGIDVTS